MSLPDPRPVLRRSSAFAVLEDGAIDELARLWVRQEVPIGENLIAQGEPPGPAYVVESGRARVLRIDETTGRRVGLGLRIAGDLLGERALLTREPRSATVRAATDLVVWRIEAGDFAAFLDRHAALRQGLALYFEQVGLRTLLRSVEELAPLTTDRIVDLTSRIARLEVEAGSTVVQEGEPGDAMFFVGRGRVRVEVGGRPVAWIEAGGYFGEGALLSDAPRNATVLAETATALHRLDRSDFDRLVAGSATLRRNLEATLARRFQETTLRLEHGIELEVPPAPAPRPPAPRRRLRRSCPVVRQTDAMECGPACLATILRLHGVRRPLAWVRRRVEGLGRHGTSLDDLGRAAEGLGFRVRWTWRSADGLADLVLPAIVHWQGYHYAVLVDVEGDRVLVADPAIGARSLPRAEFVQGWTGVAGELEPTARLDELRTGSFERPRSLARAAAAGGGPFLLWLLAVLAEAGATGALVRSAARILAGAGATGPLVASGVALLAARAIRRPVLDAAWRRWDATGRIAFVQGLLALPSREVARLTAPDLFFRATLGERLRETVEATLDPAAVRLALAAFLAADLLARAPAIGGPVCAAALVATAIRWLLARRGSTDRVLADGHAREAAAHLATVLADRDAYRSHRLVAWSLERWRELAGRAGRSAARVRRLDAAGSLLAGSVLLGLVALVAAGERDPVLLAEAAVLVATTWGLVPAGPAARSLAADLAALAEPSPAPPPEVPRSAAKPPPRLVLEDVVLPGPAGEDRPPIRLEIAAGTSLAAAGAPGALLDLIEGTVSPSSGSIRFEPADPAPAVHRVRERPLVLPLSVSASVRASDLGASAGEADYRRVLERVGLPALLRALPFGDATRPGPEGLPFELGQRIDLARAVLARPEVLLVEPLSALEPGARRRILAAVLEELRGRTTVILVPARPEEAAVADRAEGFV